MSVLKIKDIDKSLQTKGFAVEQGRKHIFYYLTVDGKKTSIKTHVSHGESEIDDHLISAMKRQTKLEKKEFLDLINCPLSKDEYIQLLIDRGHICL